MPAEQVRYSVLGAVRAWRGDAELKLGWPKQRAVLSVLLLNANRLVTRATIVDGVWGDAVPASAAGLVHNYVSGLRRVLEPGRMPREAARLLEGMPAGYILHLGEGQLDLDEFHALLGRARAYRAAGDLAEAVHAYTDALALWDVPPLAGITGPMAEAERIRLTELHVTLMEERIEALLELGEHHEVTSELLALAGRYPLRERLSALLMTTLYRSGRQAEALEVYARSHSLLAEELGIDPGPELQQLHRRILAGDPELAAIDGGSIETSHPVPHQLPADAAHFTGRADHLRRVTAMLGTAREGNRTGRMVMIGAIDGMGGVGKSALAIHAAHQLADAGKFPDGQLYVNLQDATPGLDPLPPLDALGRMLRALGVAETQVPAQLDEAAALFRTVTAGRRLLLVLDNARDAAQVRQLLPASPTCAVLVTSRQVLATLDHGEVWPVHLEILPEAEALELLGRLTGSPDTEPVAEAAAQVVRCCGYLPLAIRVAAARLAARPSWTLDELAGRLADAAHRLAELTLGELGVRASFDVSVHALRCSPDPADQAAARAFWLLSLPDGPDIDIMSAAALLGRPQDASQALLERLVDAQLLQTPRPGRYEFHDLLRLYARQRASESAQKAETEQVAALTRLLSYYTVTAWHTLALLRPADHRLDAAVQLHADAGRRFPDTAAALEWLEAERANLLAAVEQALAAPATFGELAIQLTSALFGFFLVRGYWADGARANQIAMELARSLEDRTAQVQACSDLGTFCQWLGRYQQALNYYEHSVALARELGDRYIQARSLNGLGLGYWRLGYYQDAVTCHQECLALARQLGDQRSQATSLSNLGTAHQDLGHLEEALAHQQDSVILFRELRDRRGQAGTLINLGNVYVLLGRYEDAVTCQRDSLHLFRELGDEPGQALSLNSLGVAYVKLGRYEDAVSCQRDSLRMSRRLGGHHGQAEALRDLGDALVALGHMWQARQAWQEALKVFEGLQDPEAEHLRSRLAT